MVMRCLIFIQGFSVKIEWQFDDFTEYANMLYFHKYIYKYPSLKPISQLKASLEGWSLSAPLT